MNHIYDENSISFYDHRLEQDISPQVIQEEFRSRMAHQPRQTAVQLCGHSNHHLQSRDAECRHRDQRELSLLSPPRSTGVIHERPPLFKHSANELGELELDGSGAEQQYQVHPTTRGSRNADYISHPSGEETRPSGTDSLLFQPETTPSRRRADLLPNSTQHPGPDASSSDDESPAPPAFLTSRAHKLKRKLTIPPGTPGVSTRKKLPEHDPENHEIKHMRQIQHMTWSEIARILNEKRSRTGRPATLTEAAVYGRFVRNGKRIAEATGEVFNPSDYMHLKHPKPAAKNVKSVEAQPKFSEEMDELLVRAVDATTKRFWKHVADELQVTGGVYYSEAVLQKRFNAI